MSGIIAVGNKHITSALNTEDKHHVRANPEKPSPVLCCCSPPSPLEWPVNISPSYPDPTDVQSVPLSLQITYTAYFPRAALAHQQHEALRLQTGSQKNAKGALSPSKATAGTGRPRGNRNLLQGLQYHLESGFSSCNFCGKMVLRD